ncbi:MAG: hypothetical protein Q9227_008902 [Pyrenula ochraceoflavens]
MAIESIPIIILEDDDMGMELPLVLAIDIPDMVVVGEADVDMDISMPLMLEPDIDIMLLSIVPYEADHVFGLPTIAFFMCAIGIFTIGHVISQVLSPQKSHGSPARRRTIAAIRYLSYRMDFAPKPYYWPNLDWGNSPPLGTRSGWMALACMPFIFATATKANWITLLTGVTHEKLQVFHRWISYAFFILALLHTFPFIVYHIRHHDMVAQVTETTAAVYIPCFIYPWLRTLIEYGSGQRAQIFVEDNGFTRITIPANFEWVPGQHCFLRFRSFGIHALTSHPFTICSLPSTSPDEQSTITFYIRHRGGFTARLYNLAMKQPGVSVPVFVDGPYGGIDPQKYRSSDRLVVIAGGSGAGWSLPFIEQFIKCSLSQTEHEQVAGIEVGSKEAPSSSEGYVPHNRARPLSLRVILATRDTATRIWFHKTVRSLLSKYSLPQLSNLDVQVYLTGEAEQHSESPKILADLERSESFSSAENISAEKKDGGEKEAANHKIGNIAGHELNGRPQLPAIIEEEAAKAAVTGESVGVFVCGPDTLQNDVRNAVARENLKILKSPRTGGVYLHLEHFSWA